MSEEPDAEPGIEPGDADDPDAELPGEKPESRADEPRVPLSRLTRLGAKLGGEITALKEELASLKAQNALLTSQVTSYEDRLKKINGLSAV